MLDALGAFTFHVPYSPSELWAFLCLVFCLLDKNEMRGHAYIEKRYGAFLASRHVSRNRCDGDGRRMLERAPLPAPSSRHRHELVCCMARRGF